MSAYYNEIEPYPAQWLRNLIAAGHIAPGAVDERSIVDVSAADVRGFTQCHFFAGIGIWSHALRLAGWPDEREVWTGSCPCQPFSSAGRGAGIADSRHLWPHFLRLIRECRPVACFGEQVSGKDGLAWLDHVFLDLEAEAYTCGAISAPACSVGAPHIRQRLYWMANAKGGDGKISISRRRSQQDRAESGGRSATSDVAYAEHPRFCGSGRIEAEQDSDEQGQRISLGDCDKGVMGDADSARSQGHGRPVAEYDEEGRQGKERHGATAGFWSDAEWLPCIDGKARPTKLGLFPLAHGYPGRVGILRAAGNALVAPQAAHFIAAAMECLP